MKFEDRIKKVVETMDESVQQLDEFTTPTGTPPPATAGAPNAANPAQVAPQQGQQQQQQGQAPQGQQEEITSDEMLNWAINLDPQRAKEFEKFQGDEKFQAIYDAMQTERQSGNPANPSNPGQTTSAAPAATNTSGTMGAGSVQV